MKPAWLAGSQEKIGTKRGGIHARVRSLDFIIIVEKIFYSVSDMICLFVCFIKNNLIAVWRMCGRRQE